MAARRQDIIIAGHDRASAKFARVGMSAGGLGAKLSMLKLAAGGAAFMIGMRLVRMLGSAMKEMAQFEKQVASVSTMLSDQQMNLLPGMAKAIGKLSMKYGQGTETISKGLYDILSASIDASKAIGVLEVATKAAIGGMTDTGIAADALTSILNAYQIQAEYSVTVSDMLFATVKKGKLTYQELAENIGKVASIGALAGVKLRTLLATLSTMTRQGISADRATTALYGVISKILKPAEKARKVWDELGVAYGETAIKAKGLIGVIDDLSKAQATTTQLAVMFPKKALLGVAALKRDFKGLKADIDFIADSTGEADKAFGKMAETGAQKMAELSESWKAFKRMLGEELLPTMKKMTPAIKRAVTEPAKEARDQMTRATMAVGKFIWTLGGLAGEAPFFDKFGEWVDKINEMQELAAKPTPEFEMMRRGEARRQVEEAETAMKKWNRIQRELRAERAALELIPISEIERHAKARRRIEERELRLATKANIEAWKAVEEAKKKYAEVALDFRKAAILKEAKFASEQAAKLIKIKDDQEKAHQERIDAIRRKKADAQLAAWRDMNDKQLAAQLETAKFTFDFWAKAAARTQKEFLDGWRETYKKSAEEARSIIDKIEGIIQKKRKERWKAANESILNLLDDMMGVYRKVTVEEARKMSVEQAKAWLEAKRKSQITPEEIARATVETAKFRESFRVDAPGWIKIGDTLNKIPEAMKAIEIYPERFKEIKTEPLLPPERAPALAALETRFLTRAPGMAPAVKAAVKAERQRDNQIKLQEKRIKLAKATNEMLMQIYRETGTVVKIKG